MLNFNPKKFKPSIGNISRIKAHEAYTNITKNRKKPSILKVMVSFYY